MERKVGEVFEYQGHKLKVIEQEDCVGCYFFQIAKKQPSLVGDCCKNERKDGKNVIFKLVE